MKLPFLLLLPCHPLLYSVRHGSQMELANKDQWIARLSRRHKELLIDTVNKEPLPKLVKLLMISYQNDSIMSEIYLIA